MTTLTQSMVDAINSITEKISNQLLEEFLQLPHQLQKNVVPIKSAQLLLANILCSVAENKDELDELSNRQLDELKILISDCAMTGFAKKFGILKH